MGSKRGWANQAYHSGHRNFNKPKLPPPERSWNVASKKGQTTVPTVHFFPPSQLFVENPRTIPSFKLTSRAFYKTLYH